MLRVLGRVCFSLVFLWSAVHLARHTTAAGTLAVGHYAAAVCAAVGVLLLLSDWQPRSGAMLLAVLLLPATYLVDVVPLSAVRRSASLSPSFSQCGRVTVWLSALLCWPPQAVARGDVEAATGEYVSTLKSVALLGSLLMVISYEAELSSLKPSGAQVNEQSR